MGGFFSLDSKFMQAMSRVADLIILNVIYLVTCLPGRHHRRGRHGDVHRVLPPGHGAGGKSGEGLLPGVPG